jgi:hypothetical protein
MFEGMEGMDEGMIKQMARMVAGKMAEKILNDLCRHNHMGLLVSPDKAHLLFSEAGKIMGVPFDVDCPEFRAVKEIMDQAAQFRRPPKSLIREMNQRMNGLSYVMHRQMLKERASFN